MVGFAYISDYLYPVFNPSELVYGYKTQTVAYMTADGLMRVNGIESKYYLGLFNNNVNTAEIQKTMEEDLFFANISFRDNLLRISGATLKIQSTGDMAYIFITFVLILTGFFISFSY
ncbi:hypothetical protein AZF37_07075 [endosymbiont 'TC1' of Trimyema compressum]|nr:hypothetical protein AZF37_07075 [endosymbiont 'TC1' of Trimyema compressum]